MIALLVAYVMFRLSGVMDGMNLLRQFALMWAVFIASVVVNDD